MSRFAKYPEALPVSTVFYAPATPAASNVTATQPVIRTVDATTAFLVDVGGGTHDGRVRLKIVNSAGTAQQGLVRLSVRTTSTLSATAFTVNAGTAFSVQNAGGETSFAFDVLADATGIVDVTVLVAAAGTLQVVAVYGDYQLYTTLVLA